MNKNVFLGAVAALAMVIVAGLLLFSPDSSIQFMESSSKMQQPGELDKKQNKVNIIYHEKVRNDLKSRAINNQKSDKKKKIDKTVKSATVDINNRYILALIDSSNIGQERVTKGKKYYIKGKVNGGYFVLDVPENLVYRDNIKLRIIDKKTRNIQEIDATPFLSELPSIDRRDKYFININMDNLKDIQSKIIVHDPDIDTALPPIN